MTNTPKPDENRLPETDSEVGRALGSDAEKVKDIDDPRRRRAAMKQLMNQRKEGQEAETAVPEPARLSFETIPTAREVVAKNGNQRRQDVQKNDKRKEKEAMWSKAKFILTSEDKKQQIEKAMARYKSEID